MRRTRPTPKPAGQTLCPLCGTSHLDPDEHSDRYYRVNIVRSYRTERGEYDPPLPSPAKRRHIRIRAGKTQQDVADDIADLCSLNVSRDLVCRWEKPTGYAGDYRLPGREPTGAKRRAYAALLEELKRMPPATKQSRRLRDA